MRLRVIPAVFLIVGLIASAIGFRAPGHAVGIATEPSAHDFDFLLGTWEFTAQSMMPKAPPRYYGRWTAERTGGGQLVEDVFRAVDSGGTTHYLGVTYRAFDSTTKHWTTAFVAPPASTWSLGSAWREGDVMREVPDSSKHTRARFDHIGSDHFTWTFDVSKDGGNTWINDFVKVEAHRTATRARP